MIDPKELRIGNYVRSLKNDSSLCFGGNLPFWEVTIDDMLHILNNPKNYEPIPLTEDCMIKFGFEIRYFKDDRPIPLWWKVEGNRHIDIYPKGEGLFFLINSIQMSVPIIFVHQIQNLYFALTGQELIYNENHK